MTSSKHHYAIYDQFAPNFDMADKTIYSSGYLQSINTVALEMVNVSELVQRKLKYRVRGVSKD